MYPVYTQNNFLCSYVSIVTEWVINYWVSDEVSYREAFVCRNLIKILWRNFVFQTKLAHGVLIYMWLLSVADSVHNIFLGVIFSICLIYTNLSMGVNYKKTTGEASNAPPHRNRVERLETLIESSLFCWSTASNL